MADEPEEPCPPPAKRLLAAPPRVYPTASARHVFDALAALRAWVVAHKDAFWQEILSVEMGPAHLEAVLRDADLALAIRRQVVDRELPVIDWDFYVTRPTASVYYDFKELRRLSKRYDRLLREWPAGGAAYVEHAAVLVSRGFRICAVAAETAEDFLRASRQRNQAAHRAKFEAAVQMGLDPLESLRRKFVDGEG